MSDTISSAKGEIKKIVIGALPMPCLCAVDKAKFTHQTWGAKDTEGSAWLKTTYCEAKKGEPMLPRLTWVWRPPVHTVSHFSKAAIYRAF